MSIRAYRINALETKGDATFNLWHDSRFMDFLSESEVSINTNENGGAIEISVEVLKDAVKCARTLKLKSWVLDEIKDDIKFAKKMGNEYILYNCY